MKSSGDEKQLMRSNSTLVIGAGCAVAFMFMATVISILLYQKNMEKVAIMNNAMEATSYDYVVEFISGDDDSDYYQSVYNSALEYGMENGVYIHMMSDSLNVGYTKYQLMEMAIDAGCDGIIVAGDTTYQMSSLIKKAQGKGINVVTMVTDVPDSGRISYVGVNNYSLAHLYATEIYELLDEELNVVILESVSDSDKNIPLLVNGIQEAVYEQIDSKQKVNFSTRIIDSTDAFSVEEYVQDFFQTEEMPDAIICLDELITTCVYQALIDYNKVGRVTLLGYYQSDTILEGINRGVINSTISIDTESMGVEAAEAFCEYQNTGYTSDYYGVDAKVISKLNVKDYLSEVADE